MELPGGKVDADESPTPVERDAVRWLAADELEDVDWLEPDRPFLDAIRLRLPTK